MNIGITGATGFLGRAVIDLALQRGHEVIAFSRNPARSIPGCDMREFSVERRPEINGCEALIHLAGEPVVGYWTAAKKQRIRASRVEGTRLVAEAIRAAEMKPEVLVCASGVGIYGDAGERELIEEAPLGTGFLAETARDWEAEGTAVADLTRVVTLRTSMVLGTKGGALAAMTPIFRLGLGARLGDGQQWVPWIHIADWALLTLTAVENLEVRGPVNAVAPWPVRNVEFTQALAEAVHRPAWFVAPRWALGLMGGFSAELLESRRVVPAKATEWGFRFKFPELRPALKDLLP